MPGPQFKGVDASGSANHAYYLWVDRYNTLGLGNNVPIASANGGESLMALVNGKFVDHPRSVSAGLLHQARRRPHRRSEGRLEGQGPLDDVGHAHRVPQRRRHREQPEGLQVPGPTGPARELSDHSAADRAWVASGRSARRNYAPGSERAVARGQARRIVYRPLPRRGGARLCERGGRSLRTDRALGAVIYGEYRISVRVVLQELQLNAANGSFELKEHLAAIGLGMLPAYWWSWRQPDGALRVPDRDTRVRRLVEFPDRPRSQQHPRIRFVTRVFP